MKNAPLCALGITLARRATGPHAGCRSKAGIRSIRRRAAANRWPSAARAPAAADDRIFAEAPPALEDQIFAKKSLPLSSTMMNAGKSSTSIRQMASIPSSSYSWISTFLMQFFARMAAGPPTEPR